MEVVPVRQGVQVIDGKEYQLKGILSDEHIAAERRAYDVARGLFDDRERMLRETYKAQMALEQAAEGWPEGHTLTLWRFRYTTSCTPDGKPCWVYHTLVDLHHVDNTQRLRVLTPNGIQLMSIEPRGEYWEITVKSVADLPDDWMVKVVPHMTRLVVKQPIVCDCKFCKASASSIVIEDVIEDGHVLVSEAMRRILDEIDG